MTGAETGLDRMVGDNEGVEVEIESTSNSDISKKGNYQCVKNIFALLIIMFIYIYLFVLHVYEINELDVIDNIIHVVVNESDIMNDLRI